jgi:WD40 repeat protein/predicted Ser/Thr protein kinase
MTEGPSDRAEALFYEAADLPAEQRRALLDAACAGEPGLRAEVERLLANDARLCTGDDAAAFLKSPVVRPPAAPDTLPATDRAPWLRVERYRVLRVLGEGGMGTVYEAEQDNPRRTVALKVIRPGLVSPALLKRFAREAQILGRLQHPGIAQIYEAGLAEDGGPFFAMEFVRGVALDEHARLRSLTLPARLELLARVCDAVQHAHDQGVIHRDLKPGNILVDETGRPRVLDFGVARAAGIDLAGSTAHTGTGQLIGTLGYMSPEQVAADPAALDHRSDVYALGVILFELLAGRLPYPLEGLPLPEAARVIREQEPARLGSIDRLFRGDVETIAARALEKDRARRYASAGELAADLRRHLAGEPIRARPVGAVERVWAWARRRPALAAAYALATLVLFLGLGGGLAAWAWQAAEGLRQAAEEARGEAERARQAEGVAKEKLDQVLYLHRVQLAHREWLANDVARAWQLLDECAPGRRNWEWRYVKGLSRPLLELSEPRDGDAAPKRSSATVQFSPDGRLVSGGRPVLVWDAESGKALATLEGTGPPPPAPGEPLVLVNADPVNVTFSPDGKVIAATRGASAVAIWDAATGKRLRVLGPQGPGMVNCLAFSPDGRRLALGAGRAQVVDSRLRVWDADTGEEVFSREGHEVNVSAVAFSADGRWIASGSYDHTARLWDATTGEEKRTLKGHTGSVIGVAFHPDGGRLATASDDGTVKVWGVDGKLLLTLPGRGPVHSVAYSPDGKLLAAGLDNGVITLWDGAGKEAFAIRGRTGRDTAVTGLSFSPDGKRLASAGCGEAVRVWDATAPQEVRTIPLPLFGTSTVALSGDGRRLAEGRSEGDVLVWELGEQPRPVTLRGHKRIVRAIDFSPDEGRLATVGIDLTLRLWDARTGDSLGWWKAHEENAVAVAFSADGRLVATAGQSQGRSEVKVWDGDGRLSLGVSDHRSQVISVAFSPDGRRLLSGEFDGTVKARDAATGKVLWETGRPGPSASVTFSPDGRWAAAGGWNARVWDAATGEELHTLTGGANGVRSVRFSPDGSRLVAGGDEIMLWDMTTGQEALRLKGGYQEVQFSADGSRLISAGWAPAPAVKVWEAAPADGP